MGNHRKNRAAASRRSITVPSEPHAGQNAEISTARMGDAGFRAFLEISRRWNLAFEEQLGLLGLSKNTYQALQNSALTVQDVELAQDTIIRLSYVIGIYHDLEVLLPGSAVDWLRNPNCNPQFGGQSGLESMVSGLPGLDYVRRYLSLWRHGL